MNALLPEAHASAASAFSWAVREDRDLVRRYLSTLDTAERDAVVRAAALVAAVAADLGTCEVPTGCPSCRCHLMAGHLKPCDVHCGQPTHDRAGGGS